MRRMGISTVVRKHFTIDEFQQIAAALPLLVMAVQSVAAGTLMTTIRNGPSGLWYHPGIFQYLKARLWRGVK